MLIWISACKDLPFCDFSASLAAFFRVLFVAVAAPAAAAAGPRRLAMNEVPAAACCRFFAKGAAFQCEPHHNPAAHLADG